MTTATKHVSSLGEDISFGMQQTLACWATDFIDPYIGKWFQDKYKDDHHQSSLSHTWGGEIIGDSAAFFMFLGVQRLCPEPMHWFKEGVKKAFDPFYDRLGKKSIRHWAYEHSIDEDSERYRRKLDEWKDFQADNFAKSSVITVSSVAANIATQKAMGNTHTLSTIAASKVIGAAITMGTMLGIRFAIPKTTHELDEELNERYFSPLIRKTQKLVGAKVDPIPKKQPPEQYALTLDDNPILTVRSPSPPTQEQPLMEAGTQHSQKVLEQKELRRENER
jgi:hypothetical protein